MTGPVLEACRRFFKKIVVAQATGDNIPSQMKAWQAEGLIDIRVPESDEGNIAAVLRDYRAWAQYHRGGDISVYKYYKDKIPFFDDASIAQIKKDIRTADTAEGKDPASEDKGLLLQARVFLQMAQEFDEQSLDIARNLKDQEEMERGLFDGLRGEGALSPMPAKAGASQLSGDPFGYLLSDRLSAWARMMLSHNMLDDFFITNSREAIELAIGDFVKTETRIHMQKIPGFRGDAEATARLQAAFIDYLKRLSQMSSLQFHENTVPQFSVAHGDEALSMELYTISGISPHDFFSRSLKRDVMTHTLTKKKIPVKNTMLGLIMPEG